ncbi:MAG: hypothetical protein IKH77_08845 [Clostridia bacterium]|nr:hypothetical protein [Clostridia bacterium]
MTPVRIAALTADVMMLIVCIRIMARSRAGSGERSIHVPSAWLWLMIIATVGISSLLILFGESLRIYGVIVFTIMWLFGFSLSVLGANFRCIWDETGFWYRTSFGREYRFAFGDIRWIKLTTVNNSYTNYRVFMPDRHMDFDSMMVNCSAFLDAYSTWRSTENMEPWQNVAEREWLSVYRTHGPFRQKLDRAEGIVPLLILFGVLAVLNVILLAFLCAAGSAGMPMIIFFTACAALWIAPFIALMEIDRHPKWIRCWYKGPIHAKPDEEQ